MRLSAPLIAAVVVAAVGAGLAACSSEAPPRPPVSLSLQLGTRQSCGVFSGLDYDTSCLSAVYVAVRDFPSRQVVAEKCTTLSARKAELGDILRGEPVVDLQGLSANRSVTFEVRGLHDQDDEGADRCADFFQDDHWLFWGESDAVDLAAVDAAGGNLLVRIVVDCRDCAFNCPPGDCFGCAALGIGTCTELLPDSFCVPGVSFECDKQCNDDDDCFEGARTCLPNGKCDTQETSGGLCSPCALVDGNVSGCSEGFSCVGPPGSTQGFCAESCPQRFCVQGTRCNRIGNNLDVIVPP